MTKQSLAILLVVVVVLIGGYWYFNRADDATMEATNSNEEVERSDDTLETGTYKVEEDESSVNWQAGKPAIAGYVHNGKFSLADGGEFTVTDSSIEGDVVIDINSLKVLSLGGGKAGQESALEGHLKGEGFFNVEAYPTATFKITDVTPHTLPGPNQSDYTATGELTMKGVTKTITFPVKVAVVSATEAVLTGDFEIDRTNWGINYGSAKVADKITNQIIGDTVKIDLSVRLSK